MKTVVVLGSQDVEMSQIQKIALAHGFLTLQALEQHEEKAVSPKSAAQGAWRFPEAEIPIPRGAQWLLIELKFDQEHRNFIEQYEPVEVVLIDHHAPDHPPFPSLYQFCTWVVGGTDALMVGHYDHDAESAYAWWGEQLYTKRIKWMSLKPALVEAVYKFYETGVSVNGLLLYLEPSPHALIWDLLLLRGQAGIIRIPQNGTDEIKFAIGGATSKHREAIQKLMSAVRERGWYHYQTRGIGGFFVPEDADLAQVLQSEAL